MSDRERRGAGHLAFAVTGTVIAGAMLITLVGVLLYEQPESLKASAEVSGLVNFQFASPQVGFVHIRSTADVIAKTSDRGRTWHQVLSVSGLAPTATMQWIDANDGVLVGQRNDSAIVWRTADSGDHWSLSIVSGYLPAWSFVETAHFLDPTNGWVMVRHEPPCGGCGFRPGRSVYRTADGGVHWTEVATAGFDGEKWDLTFLTATHGVLNACCNTDPFFVTADGGLSWQPSRLQFDEPACSIVPPDCDFGFRMVHAFTDGSHGLLVISSCFHPRQPERDVGCLAARFQPTARELYSTTDGGAAWVKVRPLPISTGTIVMVDTQRAWDIGPDGISRTEDAGVTWTPRTQTPVPAGWFVGAAQFTDALHGFLTVADSPSAELLGFHWLTGLPDPSVRFSMLVTSDAGATWNQVHLPVA